MRNPDMCDDRERDREAADTVKLGPVRKSPMSPQVHDVTRPRLGAPTTIPVPSGTTQSGRPERGDRGALPQLGETG
jgi:hypothetical protein